MPKGYVATMGGGGGWRDIQAMRGGGGYENPFGGERAGSIGRVPLYRLNQPVTAAQASPYAGLGRDVGEMYERRLRGVTGRLPGAGMSRAASERLTGALESPWAGPSPEMAAWERYRPKFESKLLGGLSRRGFTAGGAPSAAFAKGLGEFTAPFAEAEARGMERRQQSWIQNLLGAGQLGVSGAGVLASAPWPDWMRAAELEGRAGAGGPAFGGYSAGRGGGTPTFRYTQNPWA